MKPIVEKILKSGLVDKHTVKLMEQWGLLPEDASDKVREDLHRMVEDIAEELEKEEPLKETDLNLGAMKWPVTLTVCPAQPTNTYMPSFDVQALVDKMGSFFFRTEDIQKFQLTPGGMLRNVMTNKWFRILEVETMYLDDEPICYRTTVEKT